MKDCEKVLFDYNFVHCYNAKDFTIKVSADADIYKDCDGLVMNSENYTEKGNGLNDHVKCLAVAKKTYKLCDEEIVYEGCISAVQIINSERIPEEYKSRIRNIREDYRLCSSGLMVYDEDNMLTVKILLTDQWIYGYYEIRPTYKPNWCGMMSTLGDYAAFTSIIPLTKRDENHMLVGIGISNSQIKFYVNKMELYRVPIIGLRQEDKYQVCDFGGIETSLKPGRLVFGFGNFSYIDHNIPNNYARNYVTDGYRLESALAPVVSLDKYKEPYPNFEGEHADIDPEITFGYTGTDPGYFIFGQGAILYVKYVKAYITGNRKCDESCSDADYDIIQHHRGYKLFEVIKGANYHKSC